MSCPEDSKIGNVPGNSPGLPLSVEGVVDFDVEEISSAILTVRGIKACVKVLVSDSLFTGNSG